MIISLIHPSRGRPKKAKSTYDYWMSMAANPENIEHILSLDFSDPHNEDYCLGDDQRHASFGSNSRSIIDHNDCVVEATNQAAKISTGDILIYMSDDCFPSQSWDKTIFLYFENLIGPALIKADDCLQKFESEVVTMPIINRALYSRLGYFFNPLYFSMWVDCDIFHVCKNNNWLYLCPELKLKHEHYSNGKTTKDATYTATESHWNQGLEIFNKRKLLNFPV